MRSIFTLFSNAPHLQTDALDMVMTKRAKQERKFFELHVKEIKNGQKEFPRFFMVYFI